ncbi:MAG: SDR family oxidoreductase, partial [Verrucomicrobiales bacterium]
KGRIINISTELILGAPTRTAYGGSKAALVSVSRTWALELAKYGVTVNAIAPGPVDTELFRRNNPEGSAIRAEKLARIPLGRLGSPRDIASVVKFLMSDEAGYITGQTLHIDGGSSIASAPFF